MKLAGARIRGIFVVMVLTAALVLAGSLSGAVRAPKNRSEAVVLPYADIIHAYVTHTRHWSGLEYYIRSSGFPLKAHEEEFTVINIEDWVKYRREVRAKTPPGRGRQCGWSPLEFYVTVDTRQGRVVRELWTRKKEFLPLHPEYDIPE